MSTQKYILIISAILAFATTKATALDYTSYFFTTQDVIFFAYENGTQVQMFKTTGEEVVQLTTLNKGQHLFFQGPLPNQVYKVSGSKKFAVLTGDPTIGAISGYYAMDANGMGVSTEFYTYVPYYNYYGRQLFIVFAYEPNTFVTVQEDISNGNYVDVNTFTLNKGQHWADPNLSDKYLRITADKPISALTCYDQGYFVPSANGKWSG